MKYIITNIILLVISQNIILPQYGITKEYPGKVTYKSSQYYYVNLGSDQGLKEGDTLFLKSDKIIKPAIQIKFISGRSSAGVILNSEKLKLNDEVIAVNANTSGKNIQSKEKISIKDSTETIINETKNIKDKYLVNNSKPSSFRGRFSVQSGTNFSNFSNSGNDQRWRYTFSSDASNIGGSDFSFSNYFNFYYRTNEWNRIKNNMSQNIRVYDLAVKYDFDNSMSALVGRHISQKVPGLGAIDGIQFQKSWNSIYGGIIMGSRPNITDYGLNTKLFEAGGFAGYTDTLNNWVFDNTIGLLEQTNNLNTDRRFLYFQHSSNVGSKLNVYINSEVDLYKRVNGEAKNVFSLTSFYFNTRYAPYNWISLNISYDARKNIIYYETYKNIPDNFLNRETRHSLRLGINLRPSNNLFVGLNTSYGFEKTDVSPTKNFGGYLNYSGIPIIESSVSISLSRILTSYLNGTNYGIILYKDLFDGQINLSGSYRRTDYTYLSSNYKLNQDILSGDLSIRIIKNLFLTLSEEQTFEMKRTIGRFIAELTARF